jgi:MarR family transcriptional regulator, organic hydroperoxide resistance regulator
MAIKVQELKRAHKQSRRNSAARIAFNQGLTRAPRMLGGRPSPASPGHSVKDIPADDAKLRTFMADMYAAMSLLRALRHEIASALSLRSAEYSVLLAVWYLERSGELTVRAIADHLHVAAPHVTPEVARLVDKGLLIKKPDLIDRRAVAVQLTAASRKLLSRLAPMLSEINSPLLSGVSLRELETVHLFFRSVIANGYEAINVARAFNGPHR